MTETSAAMCTHLLLKHLTSTTSSYLRTAALTGIFGLAFATIGIAQETIADVFSDPALDFERPADRARAVERIRAIENANKERARAKADAMGIPMRQELPDGTVTEIMGLDENGEFLIYTTHNANAAISSAANLVFPTPYNLDGSGVTVGVWDGGDARNTHQEFGGRVTIKNNAGFNSHATHVVGTIAAAGVRTDAKGMAPNSLIDSYFWNNDTSEMTAAAASSPAQAGKITISNHSYGFATGWRWNGSNWQWGGTGTNQNAYAVQFGQYTSQAASWDNIAYNAPYYLIFKSAGNDNGSNPSAGSQVVISGSLVTYDPAVHPPGDGLYRNATTNPANGYENISHAGNSKNIMSVGAANNAVTSGQRDPAKSTLAGFSSRGPTDDGRIKPDIVANGVGLTSTWSGSDTQYNTISGTSMSSPSAAGSAALLVDLYRNLFPGGDMRASTLKGLIIHTATDLGAFGLGNPGPDYHYGWGLMDTKKAADLIIDHEANPLKQRMTEAQLSTAVPSQTYAFTWDGISPIRATLCWTDPAGATVSAHDSRDSLLVNDLDLKIIAPDGTQHYPFVMPFVGTWTVESMSLPATTGVNSTDNVEQVLIQNPAQSGVWTVEVTHKGNLSNNQQNYSLLTSGLSAAPLSMEVARGGTPIDVGGADGVTGASVGSGTQLTYTISNVGGGQLELTTPVTISGQQNCTVTVNTQPTSPVGGGGSTNLVTTVTPATSGTWSFNISIANNDPEKDPYHWTVTGIAGSSGTVSFTPVADTYIDSLNPGANFGSANDIRLNNQTGGNPNNRLFMQGLMRFDLSSIPPGTTIESATLDFVQNNTVSGSINIYDATGTWTENGATWNNSNNLFGGTIYGTANLPGTAGGAVLGISLNASGLSRVQNWVNTPSGNHGFGVTATDSGNSQNWMSLRSREHATSAHHPRLNVTYGGGAVEAPLMIVSGDDGVVSKGGTDSIPGTQAGVGTQLTYTIKNLGSADLTMTTPVTATAGSNCSITVNTQPLSPVVPSASTDLVLTVTPSSAGSWSATVSIANNDADKNPYTWTISGSAFGSHSVTYDGNTSDSGTAPVDTNNPYFEGSTVTVLNNTGNLTKAGFTFAGWNTAANGSGTTYAPSATFNMPGSDVTLYAIWNALPVVNAGPDQNIFLTASSWTPLTLNPGLWLDAADSETITLNGSTVSQWADKSGLNRHATQGTTAAQPAYAATGLNGKGVLTFDGGDDLFSVDLDFLAEVSHSAFIVTNPTNFSNIYGAANGSQAANSLHVGFNGANYRMNFWANDFGPARSANFVAGSANIVNYIWTTGVGKQILANGKSEGANTNAGVIGTMSGGGRIGRTTGHPFFGGAIAEIIIITGAVSAESRQEIEGYLAHKWGLAANLPNDHPHKAAPPDGASATTTLAGSATDPEEDPLTTMWTLDDGPAAASFADVSATNSDVTFMQEGIYTLRLTAADEFGSAFDEVIITVGPAIEERTVTYNGNGNTSGEAPVDPQSPYEDGATVTVLGAGTLTKTGHTFTGWNTNANGSGTPYAPAATFPINANTTLHAQWTPNTYTVTFDPNGGSAPVPTSKQVTFDSAYGTLASVSLTGYSFDGWFTAASGGTEVTEASIVSTANSHTLFAQWTLIPVSVVTDQDVVYVPEGGTETFQVKLSNQPAETVTVTVSRTSGDTDITVQSGGILSFTTANWDTYQTVTLAAAVDADAANGTAMITCTPNDANYSSAVVTAIEIDKDATLTVTNDGNGTTEPSGAVIVEKGAATPITANTPVSHNFVNWTVISGFATFGNASAATTTATISADATVQANFAIKQYTLAYSAGTGGTIDGTSPQTVNHGASGTEVTAIPNTGYSFVKWSDDVATPARTDTGAIEDITVTAEFLANTYEVTLNANGGDAPTPPSIEVTFDATYGILAPATRTGYSFDGWFTAAEGGDEITEVSIVSIADHHTLYAQWTANTYTVTLEKQEGVGGSDSVEAVYDSPMPVATAPTRSGYSFGGYYTAVDGGGTQYYTAAMASARNWDLLENTTLYAKWFAGANGIWNQTAADTYSWDIAGNWVDNTIATGTDNTATFGNLSGAQTVTIDTARTIGNIDYNGTNNFLLTIGGDETLTMSVTPGDPAIIPTIHTQTRPISITSGLQGNQGLLKTGNGGLTLSAVNTFSGGLTLNGGTVSVGSLNDTLGAAGSTISVTATSTLNYSVGGNFTLNKALDIASGVTFNHVKGSAGFVDFTGVFSGGNNTTLDVNDAGSTNQRTLIFSNTANTFTGTVSLTRNHAYIAVGSLGDAVDAGNINFGANNGGFALGATAIAPMAITNRQFTMTEGNATARIENQNADVNNTLAINSSFPMTGDTGTKTLVLGGGNAGANTIASNIGNAYPSFKVQKEGAGTWSISGDMSYAAGGVNIVQGDLVLSGTNTYSGATEGPRNSNARTVTFQGIQALSANTTITYNNNGGVGSSAIYRILDDGSGTISKAAGMTMSGGETTSGMTLFVGNNGGANGGNGAGGTTGSTIALGDFIASEGTANRTSRTLGVTGANGYRLQIGNVTTILNATSDTPFSVIFNPSTAPLTIAGNVQQAEGATSGNSILDLRGTAEGNLVSGNILDSADSTPRTQSLIKANSIGDWTLSGANTYTGTTAIQGGMLEIGGSGTLGNVSAGVGDYAGNISIAATNSGKLVFNSSATQTLGGVISGAGALDVDAGTLILTNANTYTGTTTVSAGKLFIDGDQSAATGDFSVAGSATLGGTGTIGGITTIANNGQLEFDLSSLAASHNALDLAATRTLTFSGASVLTITSGGGASPGTYTLVTAPGGITGSAPATLILPMDWVATTEISGNSLVLIVTSTGSGPGPVSSFAIAGVPSQTSVGTAITGITLTALDEDNEVATSFTGTVTFGGTAGITGTSESFVGGVLQNVSITPMVIGNDLTFTVDDGSGHTGSSAFNVVSAPYDDWSAANGLTGEAADPDAILQPDGLTNLQKFAFGMDPNVANFSPLAFVAGGELTAPGAPTLGNFAPPGNPDDERAVFTRRKDHAEAGLIYTVHFSADLKQWTASAAPPTVLTDANSTSDHEVVSVPFSSAVPVEGGGDPRPPQFMRLIISME